MLIENVTTEMLCKENCEDLLVHQMERGLRLVDMMEILMILMICGMMINLKSFLKELMNKECLL